MTAAAALLAELFVKGVSVRADGDDLIVEITTGALSEETLWVLKKHKAELLLHLRGERGISMAEWEALAMNRIFFEHGVTGQPGRITAATVEHGNARRDRSPEEVKAAED